MKYINGSSFRIAFSILIIAAFALNGCTKNFTDRNSDPTRLTAESLSQSDLRLLFSNSVWQGVALGGGTQYQRGSNAFADMYSQYFAVTQTAFASDRFDLTQSRLQNHWIRAYVYALPSLGAIISRTTTADSKAMNAIARIWKAFVMLRVTDYYGPAPYFHIGSTEETIPYDAQKDIYYDLFKELTEATLDLQNNLTQVSYSDQDQVFAGDNSKWLKFGNTLRLRMALRISNVDPEKAKTEAEAAVAGGVMTDVSDDGYMKVTPDRPNALGYISSWNEMRMSTTMESILTGYQDPRLSSYFQPAITDGQYRGVRNGMIPAEQVLPENSYDNSSNVADRFTPIGMNTEPMPVIRSAEAYLLRAEGALNGWNMDGDAGDLYAKGIEMSMRTNGIVDGAVISAYISSVNVPSAPGGYFNTPALTDIPVKFSADPAKQREQIGTQKWLALFPDGQEAWAEVRRSGFPKRYAVLHSDNPDIPPGQFVRRIVFLDYDKARNGNAVEAALPLLGGGPDKGSTPLWWDKN
ncbi:MAG: SusD/RagB family nutrient-binding outer membrane lipoprotein [Flavitalea sp.]